MRRLVIGIGNRLRGDDGVGPMLAEELPGRLPAALRHDLQVRCLQQPLPELISEIAAVEAVLFIDAWQPPAAGALSGGGPRLLALKADPEPPEEPEAGSPQMGSLDGRDLPAVCRAASPFSHGLDAVSVVRLSALLHGVRPRAEQLLVPATRFAHGERFSPELRRQLPAARALLQRWCRQSLLPAAAGELPRGINGEGEPHGDPRCMNSA